MIVRRPNRAAVTHLQTPEQLIEKVLEVLFDECLSTVDDLMQISFHEIHHHVNISALEELPI